MILYCAVSLSYFLLFVSLALGTYRLVRGPTTLDRILAFDTLCIAIIGFIVVLSVQRHSEFYLEVLLIFCLLGFTSTIAFLDYMLGRRKREESNRNG